MTQAEVERINHDIISELSSFESELRFLRSEVIHLERIVGASQSGDLIGQEVDCALPDSFFSELVISKDKVCFLVKEFVKKKNMSDHCCSSLETLLEKEKESLKRLSALYAKAKWNPSEKNAYACPIKVCDERSRLKKKLVESFFDQQTIETQLQKLTDAMRDSVSKLDQFRTVEEQHFRAETELTVRTRELQAIEDEIASYNRLLGTKERFLSKISNRKPEQIQVLQIEGDKRVMQLSLNQARSSTIQAEISIRHRAVLIHQLLGKIEMIGEAIRGDVSSSASEMTGNQGDGDVPRVDANRAEELAGAIDRLRRECVTHGHTVDVQDAKLESLEKEAKIYTKSEYDSNKQTALSKESQLRFTTIMSDELLQHRKSTQMTLEDLSLNVEQLRNEVLLLQEQIS